MFLIFGIFLHSLKVYLSFNCFIIKITRLGKLFFFFFTISEKSGKSLKVRKNLKKDKIHKKSVKKKGVFKNSGNLKKIKESILGVVCLNLQNSL